MAATESKQVKSLEGEIVERFAKLPRFDTDTIRQLRLEFSERLAKTPPKFVVTLALKLTHGQIVPRFFAYELVQHHPDALRTIRAKSLADFGRGNDNWCDVDTFACYLAGPAWRERQVSDALIERWTRSRDRWWRRSALVCTVALNCKARGGRGDSTRTINICERLVADRDDMVVKALSWALRELSKTDTECVSRFLSKHEKDLAPRVLREVSNKLQTGLKNPQQTKTRGTR